MSADVDGLRRKGGAIAEILTAGSEARITCANGSDLRLGLEGRTAIPDAGDLTAPGAFGNLPCGEGFIAPVEGTAEGKLVVDGSIATLGRVSAPVELTIEAGHLVEATGDEGIRLLELLGVGGEGGTNVAELGIGTNEKAELTGNVIEDEKLLGTCHVAFGASAAIGGTVQVPVHLDCVVLAPDHHRRRRRARQRRRAARRLSRLSPVIAVPNFSEGRDAEAIEAITAAFAPATVLDSHSDAVHNRTVLTLDAQGEALPRSGGGRGAGSARAHRYVNPRGRAPVYRRSRCLPDPLDHR